LNSIWQDQILQLLALFKLLQEWKKMVFVLFIYYEMSIQNSNLNKMFCAVSQVPCSNWLVSTRNLDPDLQPLIDYGNSSITKQVIGKFQKINLRWTSILTPEFLQRTEIE